MTTPNEAQAPKAKQGIPFFVQVIIGFVAGIAFGLIAGEQATIVSPIGDVFMRLLKMLIMPLVFSSLVVGITSVGSTGSILSMGIKAFVMFILTTLAALLCGMAFGVIFQPGVGSTAVLPTSDVEATDVTLVDSIVAMFPSNVFESLADGDVLPVVIFAIFFGVCMLLIGDKAKPVKDFFQAVSDVMYKMVNVVVKLTPIGVFGIMSGVVGESGIESLIPLLKFIVVLHAALIVFIVLLAIFAGVGAKMSPLAFLKGIFSAIMMALATDSSAAAMPVAIDNLQKNLGVSEATASFVMGVGTNVCKTGSCLYQVLAVVFIGQLVGTPLGAGQLFTLGVTALLSSLGMGAIPSASIVMLTAELSSVGLPLEGVTLMAGIDRIIGGQRTCPNTIANAAIAVIIQHGEDEKGAEGKAAEAA